MSEEIARLSKIMAQRGLCSRREADILIERGWVMVDGQVVDQLGSKVSSNCHIELKPEAKASLRRKVTILLHKPLGYVSSQPEDGHKAAVELIVPDNAFDKQIEFKSSMLIGLAPAGRLDINSTGLLVMTQDGAIARQLIGENSNIEKEYLIRTKGQRRQDQLEKLRHGLSLDGQPLKPAIVNEINQDQIRMILREGKKRQIRRMCEAVGIEIMALKRVRIGHIKLADLPAGKWRLLRANEHF